MDLRLNIWFYDESSVSEEPHVWLLEHGFCLFDSFFMLPCTSSVSLSTLPSLDDTVRSDNKLISSLKLGFAQRYTFPQKDLFGMPVCVKIAFFKIKKI